MLAETSAKSAFSDQLAQRAWRRLFWADNFRARVVNGAPITDIDSSWKSYIDADADWNANIMIAIVGLERYFGARRSADLIGCGIAVRAQRRDEARFPESSQIVAELTEQILYLALKRSPRLDADRDGFSRAQMLSCSGAGLDTWRQLLQDCPGNRDRHSGFYGEGS